jgi:hypothetical protein
MHLGNAPQVLAALRNSLLTLLRVSGWSSIARALRHYDAMTPTFVVPCTSFFPRPPDFDKALTQERLAVYC